MSNFSHKDFSCILNILDSTEKIIVYVMPFKNADQLYNDTKSFDAIMMNFIVIGEMVDKLSEDIKKETKTTIDWHKVKVFRNIIAHNYFGVDAEEVWQIIQNSLINLKSELTNLIK